MRSDSLAQKEERLISILVRQVVTSSLESLWKLENDSMATSQRFIVRCNISTAAIAGATIIACTLYEGDEEQYKRIVQAIKKRIYTEMNEEGK